MKKFIAALDGLKFSDGTLSYAIYLATHNKAHLVVVFLEDLTVHSYSFAEVTTYEGGSFDEHMQELNEKDREEKGESIEIFKKACQAGGIDYSIHRDRNLALQGLLHESIYADLLIISSGKTLTRYEEPVPSQFIPNLLSDVQ